MVEIKSEITTSPVPLAELKLWVAVDSQITDALLIDLAIERLEYLEDRCDTLFVRRSVTATYGPNETIRLRGPVVSIASVEDAGGNDLAYTHDMLGHYNALELAKAPSGVTKVVYTAGPERLNKQVKNALRKLVALDYMTREGVSDKPLNDTGHGVEAIIALLNQGQGVV